MGFGGIHSVNMGPRDDAVLETALAGLASCLISRDDDVKGDEDLVLAMERQGVSAFSP